MDPESSPASGSPVESSLERIDSVLREILRHSGLELTFTVHPGKPLEDEVEAAEFIVDFAGADSELLLEKRAALLDALEYVVFKAVRLDESLFGRIRFDCQDWRWLRTRELQLAARVAAERVLETGDPFPLSPMNARERRIVHLALKNEPRVRTASEGYGPERRVVIHRESSARS